MAMKIDKYALTTKTHGTPLIVPMNKYTRLSNGTGPRSRDAGIILLFAHGASFCKEIWEPTIEELFRLDTQARIPRIREIWSLDAQNHGEGWILNEHILAHNGDLMGDIWWDYGDAIAELVKSGSLGIVDPQMNPIVVCGHSGGAVGAVLSTSFFNPPSRVPFSRIILVDPPLWSKAKDGRYPEMYKRIQSVTPNRKDVWKDFETASQWIRNRFPWDKRVLDVYIKHGLRALPAAQYPDKKSGVTLTTYRLAENMAYARSSFGYDAVDRLNQICPYVPVHLIYGDRNDMFDRDVQDTLINPEERRVFKSVSRIEDVGHLVVQEAPIKLAVFIFDILSDVSWPKFSKL